ncbi:hypothetical protein EDB80DRAFT_676224 [Ilyonectria destructans]|nr:hypothetical protein EDB80DRAFT_676224 [Ilyonectria destructans]
MEDAATRRSLISLKVNALGHRRTTEAPSLFFDPLGLFLTLCGHSLPLPFPIPPIPAEPRRRRRRLGGRGWVVSGPRAMGSCPSGGGRDRGIEDGQWTRPRARQGPGIRNPCRPRPHVISSHSSQVAKRRPDWPQGRVTRLSLKRRTQKGLRGEGQGGGDPDGEGGERAKQYLAHTLSHAAQQASQDVPGSLPPSGPPRSLLCRPLMHHYSTTQVPSGTTTAKGPPWHMRDEEELAHPLPSSAEPRGRKCRESCPRYLSCYCCYRYRYRSRQSGKYQALVSGARPSVARKMGGPVGRP